MITFSKVKESIIETYRSIKILQFGAKTADACASFGDDSSPLKDMIAIYAETSNISEPIIIGYLNKNQIALPGEKRIFSLKSDGDLSTFIHLKADGTMEIGGGDDNIIRYTPLNLAISKTDANINIELGKIATAITSIGGAYVPNSINTDISNAKIQEIQTL